MKLLLDECVVHDLKEDLTGHEVATVIEAGFGGLENGELLRAASGAYDAFITVDRNLPFQQNIQTLQLGIIILKARGITYADLKPLAPGILQALTTLKAGELINIETTE
jgi:hypothetical protein